MRLLLCSLLVLALLPAAGPAFGATNLLTNPGFESSGGSYDGWFTFGSGPDISTASTDSIFRSGVAASKIFGEFLNCNPGPGAFTVGGYGQAIPSPTPGSVYEFSGWSFVPSSDQVPGSDPCVDNRCLAKIVFHSTASGTNEISSNEIVIGDGNSPLDTWMPFSISLPVPTGALRVEALILFIQPACDTGAVFIDDTSLCELAAPSEPNLLVNPSFTSGLSGWETFGNAVSDTRKLFFRTPVGSLKMFGPFNPDTAVTTSGIFQTFPATPGSVWRLSAHTLNSCRETPPDPIQGANPNFISAKIVFFVDDVEVASGESVILDADTPVGTWTHGTVIAANSPAGTDSVRAYILFVQPELDEGSAWVDDVVFTELSASGVGDQPRPLSFQLHQNTPNPFSPSTRITFDMLEPGEVDLTIYDVVGRRVTTLLQDHVGAGPHVVAWNGKTDLGARAAAGIYRYVLRSREGQTSRSMLLIR